MTEYLTMDWAQRLLTVEYCYQDQRWECVTRLYEKNSLAKALSEAGFSTIELCGGFDGRPKGVDDTLVIFAQR